MQKIKETIVAKQLKIRRKLFTSALRYRKLKINSIKQGLLVKMIKQ